MRAFSTKTVGPLSETIEPVKDNHKDIEKQQLLTDCNALIKAINNSEQTSDLLINLLKNFKKYDPEYAQNYAKKLKLANGLNKNLKLTGDEKFIDEILTRIASAVICSENILENFYIINEFSRNQFYVNIRTSEINKLKEKNPNIYNLISIYRGEKVDIKIFSISFIEDIIHNYHFYILKKLIKDSENIGKELSNGMTLFDMLDEKYEIMQAEENQRFVDEFLKESFKSNPDLINILGKFYDILELIKSCRTNEHKRSQENERDMQAMLERQEKRIKYTNELCR